MEARYPDRKPLKRRSQQGPLSKSKRKLSTRQETRHIRKQQPTRVCIMYCSGNMCQGFSGDKAT